MLVEQAEPQIIRNLPLLGATTQYFDKIDLHTTLIICVQHLYSTTYTMFLELFKKGLKPQHLYVIGKCYSTDPLVYQQLKNDGVKVSPASIIFDSHKDYDNEFQLSLETFFDEVQTKVRFQDFEKIIILDDGAHLIPIANNKISKSHNVIGIEQTSAGYNRLKKCDIFFPIVNVARSWIKAKYESPIIIDLALKKLKQKIAHLSTPPKTTLIMGYGTLGACAHRALEDDYDIYHYDSCPEKSMISPNRLKHDLNKFDLIIGATGETSVSKDFYPYLKKAVVLSSISSSDREFDAVNLRRRQKQVFNCHTDLHINGITLLNCGFPINFDKDFQNIDTQDFQLTRSLIFGAVCQAYDTEAQNTGFNELDRHFQDFIEKQLLGNSQ